MKILYITSLSGKRVNSFMRSALVAARLAGAEMLMVCNMEQADRKLYDEDAKEYGFSVQHVPFERNPLHPHNLRAFVQLLKITRRYRPDLIHANTPIGGLLGRIVGCICAVPRVIYMAHGFHFYHGAPRLNWLLYYPIERILARWTDDLITINREDTELVQKSFTLRHGGRKHYVPGVGIELSRYRELKIDRTAVRASLGLSEEDFVFISVGELRGLKNQETLIKAFAQLENPYAKLIICGDGTDRIKQEMLVKQLGLDTRVLFLGYRMDVPALLNSSDCFCTPSQREGLPAALMEAMACGLPCIVSKIRGHVDLITNSALLHEPMDSATLSVIMQCVLDNPELRAEAVRQNETMIQGFDFDRAVEALRHIYLEL